MPVGGDCLPDVSICVDGAVCVGSDSEKMCVVPTKLDGDCSIYYVFSVCAEDLVCVDDMCKKPKVPVGGDCLDESSACVDGTVCVGTLTEKICVVPGTMGSDCSLAELFSICAEELICMNEKCSKPSVPEGGDCSDDYSVCVKDSICV